MKILSFVCLMFFSSFLSAACQEIRVYRDGDFVLWCDREKIIDVSGPIELSEQSISSAYIRAPSIRLGPGTHITGTVSIIARDRL